MTYQSWTHTRLLGCSGFSCEWHTTCSLSRSQIGRGEVAGRVGAVGKQRKQRPLSPHYLERVLEQNTVRRSAPESRWARAVGAARVSVSQSLSQTRLLLYLFACLKWKASQDFHLLVDRLCDSPQTFPFIVSCCIPVP